MDDLQKTVLTFIGAIAVAFMIAVILTLIIPSPILFFFVFLISAGYILVAGYQENGPQERSIGTFLGQLTPWIIPTGKSWWFPHPIGGATKKENIQLRELNRRGEERLTAVHTKDLSTVEVSFYLLFIIEDLNLWVKTEAPQVALDALATRAVRWFAQHYPADTDDSIVHQKENFSRYLMGETVKCEIDGGLCKELRSDLVDEAKRIGVHIERAYIDDINLAEAIVKAREAEIAETAQSSQEEKNTRTVAKCAKILKGEISGLSDAEALQAVQAEKGTRKVIDVNGKAGDFTKGAALKGA